MAANDRRNRIIAILSIALATFAVVLVLVLALGNNGGPYAFGEAHALEGADLGVTSTMQYNMIMRAREAEIENILMMMPEITGAYVNLFTPSFDIAAAPEGPAAVVTLYGDNLTPYDAEAVAQIVWQNVEGLGIQNITVTDAGNMEILFYIGAVAMICEICAGEIAYMPANFPGGPLFYGDMPEDIRELFDDRTISRYLYDTIIWIDRYNHEIAEDFPGGPLFYEDMPEHIRGLLDYRTISRYLYDTIIWIDRCACEVLIETWIYRNQ
jgi:hypothetical protein